MRLLPLYAYNSILCATLCAAACNAAAETAAPAAYRLNVEQAATLRLAAPAPVQAPAVEEPKLSISAQRLAAMPFAKLIEGAAREAAIDPALVHAVIAVESGYNSSARSPKGALGLMQVLPATALRYGIRNAAQSPAANLRAGTRYLSDLMVMFENRLELVLAAYNAGEGAVQRYGLRIPPYRETQLYVPAVLARYRLWREPHAAEQTVAAPPARVRIEYMPGTVLETQQLQAAGFR